MRVTIVECHDSSNWRTASIGRDRSRIQRSKNCGYDEHIAVEATEGQSSQGRSSPLVDR